MARTSLPRLKLPINWHPPAPPPTEALRDPMLHRQEMHIGRVLATQGGVPGEMLERPRRIGTARAVTGETGTGLGKVGRVSKGGFIDPMLRGQ